MLVVRSIDVSVPTGLCLILIRLRAQVSRLHELSTLILVRSVATVPELASSLAPPDSSLIVLAYTSFGLRPYSFILDDVFEATRYQSYRLLVAEATLKRGSGKTSGFVTGFECAGNAIHTRRTCSWLLQTFQTNNSTYWQPHCCTCPSTRVQGRSCLDETRRTSLEDHFATM